MIEKDGVKREHKSLGIYDVMIKPHPEVQVKVKFSRFSAVIPEILTTSDEKGIIMKGFLDKFNQKQHWMYSKIEDLEHQVVLVLWHDVSSDRMVIKATKSQALSLIRSADIAEKVLVTKIVFKLTLENKPPGMRYRQF